MTVSKSVGMALEVAYFYTVFPMLEELQQLLLLLLLLETRDLSCRKRKLQLTMLCC